MANFKVGDTVKLKSGGPVMTIVEIGRGVTCSWFTHSDSGKVSKHAFNLETLEIAAPEPLRPGTHGITEELKAISSSISRGFSK